MSDPLVTRDDFETAEGLDGWTWTGDAIVGGFRAGSYSGAAAFALRVAEAADEAVHHPDIDIRYQRHARVVLTTHGSGGVTGLDLELARTISDIARSTGVDVDPETPR